MASRSVTREQLYEMIWSRAVSKVAPEFGISDVALRKRCRALNIPVPDARYWGRFHAGKSVQRPPLPAAPKGMPETIVISSTRRHKSSAVEAALKAATIEATMPPLPARRDRRIAATIKALSKARQDDNGGVKCGGSGQFVVRAHPDTIQRIGEFLDHFVAAAMARRFPIRDGKSGLEVEVNEELVGFGQMRRTDFTGPTFHNGAIAFMVESGGRLPAGTTFPNHVMMGFNSTEISDGKYTTMRVTEVVAGSPAAEAGLQIGDVVSKVAGKRFKNLDGYLDATAKAAETPTFKVSITRNGRAQDLVLRRAFRPALTDVAQVSVPRPVDDPASVAAASPAPEQQAEAPQDRQAQPTAVPSPSPPSAQATESQAASPMTV